jgi:hypothetical protein
MRIIQFPTVQQFAWCAECIQVALRLFVETGMSYQNARLRARDLLKAAVLVKTAQATESEAGH